MYTFLHSVIIICNICLFAFLFICMLIKLSMLHYIYVCFYIYETLCLNTDIFNIFSLYSHFKISLHLFKYVLLSISFVLLFIDVFIYLLFIYLLIYLFIETYLCICALCYKYVKCVFV